jgi:hypothetical protein
MASIDQQAVENTFDDIESQNPRVPKAIAIVASPIEVMRHVQRLGLLAVRIEGIIAAPNTKPTVMMM